METEVNTTGAPYTDTFKVQLRTTFTSDLSGTKYFIYRQLRNCRGVVHKLCKKYDDEISYRIKKSIIINESIKAMGRWDEKIFHCIIQIREHEHLKKGLKPNIANKIGARNQKHWDIILNKIKVRTSQRNNFPKNIERKK